MSLRLWLPFDFSTDNYGVSDYKMTGSPAGWVESPVSRMAAAFSNNTGNVIYNATTGLNFVNEDFTVALWLKKKYLSKTESGMYVFTVGRADAGSYGYGIEVSSDTVLRCRYGNTSYTLIGVPEDTWCHIVFGRNGSKMFGYVNGLGMFTESALPGTLPTYTEGAGIGIGCFHYASGNIYPLIGAIADFRIYDHALTQAEIKELSQGLILHYTMGNQHAIGINNMYSGDMARGAMNGSYTRTSLSTLTGENGYRYTLTHTGDGNNAWYFIYADNIYKTNFTVGKKYIWSCMYRVNKWTDGDLSFRTAAWTNDSTLDRQHTIASTNLVDGKWHEVCEYMEVTQAMYDDSRFSPRIEFCTSNMKNSGTVFDMSIDIKNIQLIEADAYPGWIANEMVSSTVANTGGHGQNPLVRSGYAVPAASPRYRVATDFNHLSFYTNETLNLSLYKFTISFWMNPRSNMGQHFIFGMFDNWSNNGIGMYRNTGSNTYQVLIRCTGTSTYNTFSFNLALNEWHHIALVYSGTGLTAYVDGSPVSTVVHGAGAACYLPYVILGNSRFCSSGQSYPDWTEIEEAAMSDFRLYGTAFSQDEITRLYRTVASVARGGDLHALSFNEINPKANVASTGVINCGEVTESGGRVCAYTNNNANVTYNPSEAYWEYTPANADNQCLNAVYFQMIPGITTYHIDFTLTWSGMSDLSSSFGGGFQGASFPGGVWTSNFPCTALNNQAYPSTLMKNSASGQRIYSTTFTLGDSWMESYTGCYIGIRMNYSNGTGKVRMSNVRIYPAVEFKDWSVSVRDNGQAIARKIVEN